MERQHFSLDLDWKDKPISKEGYITVFRKKYNLQWALVKKEYLDQFGKNLSGLYNLIIREEIYYDNVVSVIYMTEGIYQDISNNRQDVIKLSKFDSFIGIPIRVHKTHVYWGNKKEGWWTNLSRWC